jgi:hypothetical protein
MVRPMPECCQWDGVPGAGSEKTGGKMFVIVSGIVLILILTFSGAEPVRAASALSGDGADLLPLNAGYSVPADSRYWGKNQAPFPVIKQE